MRLAFLGLGLIGGSIARAIRDGPADGAWSETTIAAWTPGGSGPRAAAAAGIVDLAAASVEEALGGADLVVLAAPPLDCLALLRRLGGDLRTALLPDGTVTDVTSTKGALRRAAGAAGVRYVGGHPMAGREAGGWAAADPTLFRGRPWVVTPPVHGGNPARVHALAERCGARVVPLDADEHDSLVAGVSHLPLIASAALVEAVAGRGTDPAPDWPAASSLGAGGWAGMTRLARGDPAMAAGILATNAPAIALRLRAYRDRLDEWLALLEASDAPDAGAAEARFTAARGRLGDRG